MPNRIEHAKRYLLCQDFFCKNVTKKWENVFVPQYKRPNFVQWISQPRVNRHHSKFRIITYSMVTFVLQSGLFWDQCKRCQPMYLSGWGHKKCHIMNKRKSEAMPTGIPISDHLFCQIVAERNFLKTLVHFVSKNGN